MRKLYFGRRLHPEQMTGSEVVVGVIAGDEDKKFYNLDLAPSLELANHSPTGFSWGYAGSGCAQLALAILLDFTESSTLALRYYQRFKFAFVQHWREAQWQLDSNEIAEWFVKIQLEQEVSG